MDAESEDERATFTARCESAMAAVQSDLDRTGVPEHRLCLTVWDNWPGQGLCAYVGLPGGNVQGEFAGEDLRPEMGDLDLLEMAATNAIGSLLIIEGLRWPRCVEHPTKYMVGIDPQWQWRSMKKPRDHRGWWWCNPVAADSPPHPVSPIGELEMKHIVPPHSRPGT